MSGSTSRKSSPIRVSSKSSKRAALSAGFTGSKGHGSILRNARMKNMSKRKTQAALLALALFFSVSPARPQSVKLKVGYPTTVGSMGVLWVAKDAGYFDKQGLNVELIYIGGSSKVVQ